MNSARRRWAHLRYREAATTIEMNVSTNGTLEAAGTPKVTTDPFENLKAAQACKQREAKQRDRAEDEAEREGPKGAAPARLFFHARRNSRRCHQRMLARDHASGDIVGDRLDDEGDVVGLREH